MAGIENTQEAQFFQKEIKQPSMETQHQPISQIQKHTHGHYKKLFFMAVLSFISMYTIMYAMVDTPANVIPNINQFYMAMAMTAPMIIIEVFLMHNMYKNIKLNAFVVSLSLVTLVAFILFIRNQTAVSDKQFLKSMIPHHAAAVLMVKETKLQDTEIQKLADGIISSQQKEIDFMKAKLKQLEN